MAAAGARCSAGGQLLVAVTSEGGIMVSELQWDGFACVADSGIREALDAAGVDCAMSGRPESEYDPECDAVYIPGQVADDQSTS